MNINRFMMGTKWLPQYNSLSLIHISNDIVKANEVLKNVVERTPLDFDRYLSEKYGATIYIKKENMQKVRSFKLRGAYYAIHQLSDEDKARGVVCASAGNHAQGDVYKRQAQ